VVVVAAVDHILTTERLVLRPVTADDHALLLTHWAVRDVRRFLFDGAVLSAPEIGEAIEASVRDFAAADLYLTGAVAWTGLIRRPAIPPSTARAVPVVAPACGLAR
jgi:hypothetical protein